MQDHRQLEIWQRSMSYAARIYEFCAQLPEVEKYNLGQQLRKAVTSVPLNITEGAACTSTDEFKRFLGYAYPSLKEIETCLELCARLYPSLPSESVNALIEEANQISRMTHGLARRLPKR
jgi:four helix bundle protein